MASRSGNPEDRVIGQRLRFFRLERGWSQSDLGGELGLSFQQVQKYEKGANRLSATRLSQIAALFKVPVMAFYDGTLQGAPQEQSLPALELLQTAEALRLVRAYARISNSGMRRALVTFAEAIAERPAPDGAETGRPGGA
jgi:transcriptional regulator with XRE-family HTH domain